MKPKFTKTKGILSILGALLLYASGLATGLLGNARPKESPVLEQYKFMRVTAYCPCEKCCGRWADGFTASGYKIQKDDRFVAAPKDIPFGTKLIVPGYNNNQPVEVRDRGGSITNQRLDVFFDSHQEALEWGVKILRIEIVKG